MKKSSYFYSQQQLSTLEKASKSDEKAAVIAAKYSKEFNRPINGVYCKIIDFRRKNNGPTTFRKKAEKKGIVMPEGFTFDFTPKKAVMHKDKVVLYF
jgi:hypothetical protein